MKNTISFNQIKVILTDIEGTTTSISFVHEVLFPYSLNKMADYLKNPSREISKELSKMTNPLETLSNWIKQDKKEPLLKKIQGEIWNIGYENGELKGHVYPEVAKCLADWKNLGKTLAVYSSGSVQAQKLIFGYSVSGDLTKYFTAYFDTAVGHKREVKSYLTIADKLKTNAAEILFLSDIKEELDAAKEAGMQTCQLKRLDNVIIGEHLVVKDFLEIPTAFNHGIL